MFKNSIFFPAILVLLAVLSRWVPHAPNFAPIGAIALFAGARFTGNRKWALSIPLAALLISDLVLGFYDGMIWTYFGFASVVFLGFWISKKESALRIGSGAVLSSISFFLLSNFGVWLSGGLYEKTTAGLAQCFAAAIPFYHHTLAGDLFYTTAVFGVFHFVSKLVSKQIGSETAKLSA